MIQEDKPRIWFLPGQSISKEETPTRGGCLLGSEMIFAPTLYDPQRNDFVIGVVKGRLGENYAVDINGPQECLLGQLQFDGADKRSRPNLAAGCLLYCRVCDYDRDLGGRMSCINKGFNAGGMLGELKGGLVIRSRRHLHKCIESKMDAIAKHCKFEVALGKNGWVWVKGGNQRTTMLVYNIFNHLLSQGSELQFQQMLSLVK